jgi:inorganic triphosphatase YgiF
MSDDADATAPREVELKLRVPGSAVEQLRDSEVLRRHARGSGATKRLHNIYYDTPDHRLAGRMMAFRVRRIGGRFIQTLKAASDGDGAAQDRPEWEVELADGTPDLRAFGDPTVLERAGLVLPDELSPVFASRVRRDIVLVDWPHGRSGTAQIEVDIDVGWLEADGRKEPLAEVELELKEGSAAALFELAEALRRTTPLAIETLDKAARGYRLATGRVPPPVWAETPRLDGDAPLEAAMAAIFRQGLVQWMRNEVPAVDGSDPEGLHQLRVALRRLRSALALFGGVLVTETRERWNGELRWLLGRLGPARDLDVLLTELLPVVQPGPGLEAEVAALREAAMGRRAEAYAELGDAIASDRYADLLFDFACWIERQGWRAGLDVDGILAQQEPTLAFARRTLEKRWHGIRKRLRHVADLEPEQRHKLRISLKKLRYSVDFFAGLFAGEDARLFRKRLAGLQDVLGHMNDTAVARRLVSDAVATLEAGERRDAAEVGAGILLGWYAGHQGDIQSSLRRRVAKLRRARLFWEER